MAGRVADERVAALAELDEADEWTVELEALAEEPPRPEDVQGAVDAALASQAQAASTSVKVRRSPDGRIIVGVVLILVVGAIAVGSRRRAVHDVAEVVALSLERFGPVVSEMIKSAA